jgi:hypothetical protein
MLDFHIFVFGDISYPGPPAAGFFGNRPVNCLCLGQSFGLPCLCKAQGSRDFCNVCVSTYCNSQGYSWSSGLFSAHSYSLLKLVQGGHN